MNIKEVVPFSSQNFIYETYNLSSLLNFLTYYCKFIWSVG